MLREQWSAAHTRAIEIKCVGEDGRVKQLGEWDYPGSIVLGLPALVVEANAIRPKWEMPKTIGEIVAKLGAIGVVDTAEFKRRLAEQRLNADLHAAGLRVFSAETLAIFSSLLGLR